MDAGDPLAGEAIKRDIFSGVWNIQFSSRMIVDPGPGLLVITDLPVVAVGWCIGLGLHEVVWFIHFFIAVYFMSLSLVGSDEVDEECGASVPHSLDGLLCLLEGISAIIFCGFLHCC